MKNKQQIFWAVIVVVVLAVIWILMYMAYGRSYSVNNVQSIATTTSTNTNTTGNTNSVKPQGTTVTKVSTSGLERLTDYAAAIKTYNGKRFQFSGCVATPSKITVKDNTKILLDNRSVKPIKINFDAGRIYTLGAYEFGAVTLGSVNKNYIIDVGCEYDGQVAYKVARILIEP